MRIAVCIKRVPDTESRIRIADDGNSIDPTGVKYVVGPYGEFALETALRLREAAGEGEVVVISVGAAAAEQLRAGLAMGADRAILLKGEPGMDGLATARALAAELNEIGADLVLTGMKATDDDQQQVGPMIATLLGIPCITVVASLDLADGRIEAHREVDGGVEHVESSLPAVVSITKTGYDPRLASLKGIMAARKKPFEEKDAQLGESRIRLLGLTYPPERPEGRIVGNGADAVPELVRLLREEARVI